MKKLILYWLFGTSDISDYLELLRDAKNYCKRLLEKCEAHDATKRSELATLRITKDLMRICENHGIDFEKEIKALVSKPYPCDEPDSYCPYDAQCYEDCRVHCGLGVDED